MNILKYGNVCHSLYNLKQMFKDKFKNHLFVQFQTLICLNCIADCNVMKIRNFDDDNLDYFINKL